MNYFSREQTLEMTEGIVPRILITRLSAIGDCVLTMPLLCALRDNFRNAHIAWAVEAPSDQLLQGHPALNQIITIPKNWLKSWKKIAEVRSRLRAQRFDIVIDPQGLTKSSMLGWLSGAKRRLGLARPWSRELAPWLQTENIQPAEEHIVPRSMEILKTLGIRRPEIRFDFPISDATRSKVDELLWAERVMGPFAIVNPGASWFSKQWETDRFGAVARFLGEVHRLPTIVTWAGEKEFAMAKAICESSSGHAKLAPKTSLRELAALIARARLFIGSDTGPLHISVAVGTTVIGMFGVTQPSRSGAWGPQHVNLQAYYQDGTSRERRSASNEAMKAITVNMVCHACDTVLRKEIVRVAA